MNKRDAFQAGMTEELSLPEVRNLQDKRGLMEFMITHGLNRIFAGVEYNAQVDQVLFNSNQKNALIPSIPFCKQNDNRNWETYEDKLKNWPWTYLIVDGDLTLCPHSDYFMEFPICYQKATSVTHVNSISDSEICKHRQKDTETTLVDMMWVVQSKDSKTVWTPTDPTPTPTMHTTSASEKSWP